MEPELELENESAPIKTVTSDLVLQAALKLFAEKGYFNTSLPEIREALGASNANAITQHFKTKQALAQALRESILDSLSISIDDIRRRNRKASDQLRELVDLLFRLTDDAPDVIKFLFFMDAKEFLPEAPALLDTPAFNKIKRILQNGINDNEIKSLDTMLAYCYFFGIIQTSLQQVLLKNLPKSADNYQSQVWLAAWNSIVKK